MLRLSGYCPSGRLAVVCLAAVSLSCNGASQFDDQRWASGACTSISEWQDGLSTITRKIPPVRGTPGRATRAIVLLTLARTRTRYTALTAQLRELRPTTNSSRRAQRELDALVRDMGKYLQESDKHFQSRLMKLPRELTPRQTRRQLMDLKAALVQAYAYMYGAIDQMVFAAPDMRQRFADSAACDEIAGR